MSHDQNVNKIQIPPLQNAKVTAILGPTNTGKTYYALDRMMGYDSGMVGFPLRLLARENYDRVCRIKGVEKVALLTGEEKIIPKGAKYFLCTVEAMPMDRAVAFMAIDEIQLCADPERGHIFTQRLLHSRGLYETAFLGAETMRPMIEALIPGVEIITRPRFSTLTYTGFRKVTRLPRRSAAIAFSTNDVYALAELIRRHLGGTAVVLGALSPRTRNAQVELYQAGEVDYLVATDAIGMGLNMDIDHVAFADLGKFDGRVSRNLKPTEIAQIAGRAGRHMRDGTFGTTAEAGLMLPEMIEAVEHHRFDPVTEIQWRNADLDFRTPERLLASLDRSSPRPELRKAAMAEDHEVLLGLTQDAEIRRQITTETSTKLLWEVCQIPDFRQIMSDAHVKLCAQIFGYLHNAPQLLPHDWIAGQVSRLERTEGDIDALMARLAHIRTWTYIAHRADWLENPLYWQEKTRSVEDRLSDALHERLTNRFIDRRSTVLMRRLHSGVPLLAAIRHKSEVVVEGEFVGVLDGFRFVVDPAIETGDDAAVKTAARRALVDEIQRRVQQAEQDEDSQFTLGADARIVWREAAIARLTAGPDLIHPHIDILDSDLLDGSQRDRLTVRCEKWVKQYIETILGPVLGLGALESGGGARGIAFQIHEALGAVSREQVADLIAVLDKDQRVALHRAGVRLGPVHAFVPKTAKTHAVNLRALLWSLKQGHSLPAPVPANGRTSIRPVENVGKDFYDAIGYPVVGPLAIRVDILDRVIGRLHDSADQGRFSLDHSFAELLGCTLEDLMAVLAALGYQRDNRPPPVAVPVDVTVNPEAITETVTEPEATETPPSEEVTDGDSEAGSETAVAAAIVPPVEKTWYRLTRPSLTPRPPRVRHPRPERGPQDTPPNRDVEKPSFAPRKPGPRSENQGAEPDRKASSRHPAGKPASSDQRSERRPDRSSDRGPALPQEKLLNSPFAALKDLVKK
jgi:ATP-dependent RNA helicase SUPV3L1/SUV3